MTLKLVRNIHLGFWLSWLIGCPCSLQQISQFVFTSPSAHLNTSDSTEHFLSQILHPTCLSSTELELVLPNPLVLTNLTLSPPTSCQTPQVVLNQLLPRQPVPTNHPPHPLRLLLIRINTLMGSPTAWATYPLILTVLRARWHRVGRVENLCIFVTRLWKRHWWKEVSGRSSPCLVIVMWMRWVGHIHGDRYVLAAVSARSERLTARSLIVLLFGWCVSVGGSQLGRFLQLA